jgi:hypothetical protein
MMYLAYDRGAVALVVIVAGRSREEDTVELGRALLTMDSDAKPTKPPLTILVVSPDAERPSAQQRQRMADVWLPMKAPLHLFSLVTTSKVDRGILKVIQWLNPPGDRRREAVHSTFEEAAKWMEHERGAPIPGLRAQFEQVTNAPRGIARAR